MTCHFCQRTVRQRDLNQHHITPRSEGGQEVAPAHKRCHINHHSRQGHFREWGRKGGLAAALTWVWIFNLRYGAGPPDPLRRIPLGRA